MRQAGRYLPEYRATRAARRQLPEAVHDARARLRGDAAAARALSARCGDSVLGHSDDSARARAWACSSRPAKVRASSARCARAATSRGWACPIPNVELRYVMDAVRLIRRELNGRVPLIGFAGSPWTVGDLHRRRRQLARVLAHQGDDVRRARDAACAARVLATSTRLYLNAQIDAGAQAVMIFDTWGGVLDAAAAIASSRCSYMQRIVDGLARASAKAGACR